MEIHITNDTPGTMNTIEAHMMMDPKNEKVFNRAIELLDALVRPGSRAILEFLYEHRDGSYVDLLVHCRESELGASLRDLIKAGIIIQRKTYWGTRYRINQIKLFRVRRAALGLTTNEPDTVEILRAIEIGANS
ncbi:MAG: hypothetical protein ACOYOO_04750 [Saprospiraceae bacterium]|jgi:hypothetical protein